MQPAEGTRYGRTRDEWDQLRATCRQFLVERAQIGRDTSYTELNTVLAQRTTARTFDFDLDSERGALGELLGDVSLLERPTCGHLISAIVLYLNDNSAGSGFYKLAIEVGDLAPTASDDEKFAFWVGEVNAVFEYYRQTRRRR
jgi:hypothetical protein